MRDDLTPAGASTSMLCPAWPLKRLTSTARLSAPDVISSQRAAWADSTPPSWTLRTNAPGPIAPSGPKDICMEMGSGKFGIDKRYQVSEFRVDRTRGIFSDT